MITLPTWVNKDLYPFDSRFTTIDNHRIHYVDEGQGQVLLFVNGTPEWSFGFRDLIKNLRGQFRCIAIDLLGFGLSDKPKINDYTCAGHALRLKKFIEQLEQRISANTWWENLWTKEKVVNEVGTETNVRKPYTPWIPD